MPTHRRSLRLLTPTEISQMLHMKPATVRDKLAEAGVSHREEDGKSRSFDSLEALSALLASGRLDLSAERARLAREQADKLEMENRVARGEYAPIDQLEAWAVSVFSGVRMRLLAVPAKAAPLVQGAKKIAEAEAVIRKFQIEALEELAESHIPPAS